MSTRSADSCRVRPVEPLVGPGGGGDETLSPRLVQRSLAHCRKVTRREARNFYYGLMLTPKAKRSALYAVYCFMRACDDLADEQAGGGAIENAEEDVTRINLFRHHMEQVVREGRFPDDDADHRPMWPAFLHVVRHHAIDIELLGAMLDAQCADLVPQRFDTFGQTYDYCFKVASTVGLVCLDVWGYTGGAVTRKLAEYRGVALQLTNMLRDLVEDGERGRIYLPAADFERFGYDQRWIIERRANEAFDRLMSFQIERARSYYRKSASLEQYLDASCRPACWAIARIYERLLDKIETRPRRVLTERVRLSAPLKLGIAARAMTLRWRKASS